MVYRVIHRPTSSRPWQVVLYSARQGKQWPVSSHCDLAPWLRQLRSRLPIGRRG